MPSTFLRKLAGMLAESVFLRRGKELYRKNCANAQMPLSKLDKLWAGSWLILRDYSLGTFPPRFTDQQRAYQAEKDYRGSIPGWTVDDFARNNMTKPFWFGAGGRTYLSHFIRLTACLEKAGIRPPAKILELGCGSGWTSEFLAVAGFEVCGTTISEEDIADAHRRIKSIEIKGLNPRLRFVAAPMETVHEALAGEAFDAVFVYEALHHAFDWQSACRSCFLCLRPGGWLLICNEPNVLHTAVSYRVARLTNTHEIGFRKSALKRALRKAGFTRIVVGTPRFHFWFRPHWISAQK